MSSPTPILSVDHQLSEQPILTLDHVSKRFGPITVVDDVTVAVHRGKIQVLLGENGAGKSTLINMVAGVHEPSSGQIIVDGEPTRIPDTKASEALGIATIHQELQLVPSLSVAENILMGRLPTRFGQVDKKAMYRLATEALATVGLQVDPRTKAGSLGIARQQLVEIAKALRIKARLLILDEPTASLTKREIEHLFGVIRRLRDEGVGMVFISHHLDEIAAIGDSVTVIRDGKFVAEVPATTPQPELVRLMVGRSIDQLFPRQAASPGEPLLTVKGLTREGSFTDVSFEVRAGEVLGIAGLVGAGRTEVVRAIAGADSYDSGTVTVHGKPLRKGRIAAAIAAGVGLVPEDRKAFGLVLGASVQDNLGYATLMSSARHGLADRRGQARRASQVATRLKIRMRGLNQRVGALSGGNQQKVVVGRWISAGSRILLLDEPTRGVDVGAKVEIYQLMNEITAAGGAVVMVSSELPEVLGMSDRILVMSDGRVAGVLAASTADQPTVMSLAVKEVESDRV
ncbi:MAG: sugar ABC transporter ATP-binding protein [Lapillicoccus sp.]